MTTQRDHPLIAAARECLAHGAYVATIAHLSCNCPPCQLARAIRALPDGPLCVVSVSLLYEVAGMLDELIVPAASSEDVAKAMLGHEMECLKRDYIAALRAAVGGEGK